MMSSIRMMMKALTEWLVLGLGVCGATACQEMAAPNTHAYQANRFAAKHKQVILVIQYDRKVGKQALLDAVQRDGSQVVHDYKGFSTVAVAVLPHKSVARTMAYYQKVKGVVSVREEKMMKVN